MNDKFYLPWENQVRDTFISRGLCRGMDVNLFMPGVGESGKEAREVCNGKPATRTTAEVPPCPVKQECLEYALQVPGPTVGVWGGTTERERRAIKRKMMEYNPDTPAKPIVVNVKRPMRHGTAQGYEQHRRRKEQPCDACKEAHSRAARGWRNRDNDAVTMPLLRKVVTLVHEENARASRTAD